MRPDAVVLADTEAHLVDIGPDPLADVRDLVHKRDTGRKQRVRRVLDHLRRASVHGQNGVPLPNERLVEALHLFGGPLDLGPDHHAVRLHEVLHRRPLPQKLGIGDHRHVGAVLQTPLGEDLLDLLARAGRHGTLVHDDALLGALESARREQVGDVPGGLLHVGQVRRPVFARGRREGEEDDFCPVDALGQIRREMEAALRAGPLEVLLQVRLVNGQFPRGELSDFFLVDVHTGHVVAHLCEAGARDEPDVAGADDRNFHTELQERREVKEPEMRVF